MLTRLKNYRAFVWICALGGFSLLAGCGGSNDIPPEEFEKESPPLKAMLLNVAETGQLGSGEMAIRQELEKMKATDAAKADPLLQDLDQMAKTNDPDQIKSQAKAMADKL